MDVSMMLHVMGGLGLALFGVFVIIQTYFLVNPVMKEARHDLDRKVGVGAVALAGLLIVVLGVVAGLYGSGVLAGVAAFLP